MRKNKGGRPSKKPVGEYLEVPLIADPDTRLQKKRRHRSRPPLIDPFDLIRLYTMAENGLSHASMARAVGMGEQQFKTLVKNNPELAQALEDGKASGDDIIGSQLMRGIRQGNTAMIIFAAKVRLRMQESKDAGQQALQDDKKQDKIDFTKMTPFEAARVYQQIIKGDEK